MRSKTRLMASALALAAILCLAACGGAKKPDKAAKGPIALITFDVNTAFESALAKAAKAEAEKLGVGFMHADANRDINQQTAAVEDAITKGAKAILIVPSDPNAMGAQSAACEKAGIPFVIIAIGVKGYYTCAITIPEAERGTLKAKAVVDAVGKGGKVMMLLGNLAQEVWAIEADASRKVFKENGITIVDEQPSDCDLNTSIGVVENWIAAGKKFDAIWCPTDTVAIGAGTACKNAGLDLGKIFIVGEDGDKEGLAAIADGRIDATIFLPGAAFGKNGIDAAYKALRGEKLDKNYNMTLELVTAKNLADYQNR